MKIFVIILLFTMMQAITVNAHVEDSIRHEINDFLMRNGDGRLLANQCFYDYQNDTCVTNIPIRKGYMGLYKISSLQLPRYIHLLLICSDEYHILNMRNSLDLIIRELNDYAVKCKLYTDEFVEKCVKEITELHQFNWEMNHDEPFGQNHSYNPNEW